MSEMSTFQNLVLSFLSGDFYIKSFVLLVLGLIAVWLLYLPSWSKLPPGPRRIPLIGTFMLFSKDTYIDLTEARKRYGNIFTVYFGNTPAVVLNGYETVREAFIKNGEVFQGRLVTKLSGDVKHNLGVVNANGHLWKVQRKFAISTLRDFGMGKSILEQLIAQEAKKFVAVVKSQDSKPFSVYRHLSAAITNVMFILMLGVGTDANDPEKLAFIDYVSDYFAGNRQTSPMNFFPWLKYMPGDPFLFKKGARAGANAMKWIHEKVELKKREYEEDPDKEPIDFIGVYLRQIKSSTKTDTTFTEIQLLSTIADLFGAGTETTAITLEWLIIHLSYFPEKQKRIQDEIEEVSSGGSRQITWDDRIHLPYTEACIAESQRMSTVVPLALPHVTLDEINFRGFDIPANTYIMANLWSVHYDEFLYPDPYSFKPERFIDSNGKFERPRHLIPFSAGPRACLGEPLVRMELFMFITALLQKVTVFMHDKVEFSKLKGSLGATIKPQTLNLVARPREK